MAIVVNKQGFGRRLMSYLKVFLRYSSAQNKPRTHKKLALLISEPDTFWIQGRSITVAPVCLVRLMNGFYML
jgi:hypothetical protein